jgi:thiamine-monophosphate kinase
MGVVPRGTALRRDGAVPGDDIWVSGKLGDAALALAALKRRLALKPADLKTCAARLHRPQPRVMLGSALRGIAHSAIDISDGLLADLGHILERSKVAAEIELDMLPKSAVMVRHLHRVAACRALLAGGDDYELCFTAPRSMRARILRIGHGIRTELTRIGRIATRVRGRPALIVRLADGSALRPTGGGGYDHFG